MSARAGRVPLRAEALAAPSVVIWAVVGRGSVAAVVLAHPVWVLPAAVLGAVPHTGC